MVKHPVKAMMAFVAVLPFLLSACTATLPPSTPAPERTVTPEICSYGDGLYRGAYNDGGIEQFGVEFVLAAGVFTSVKLNSVNYKDGNYLGEEATRIQGQVASQYDEAAAHLIGKPVSAVADLLDQSMVTSDRDAVTAATLRTGKLVSALRDGLCRGPYRPEGEGVLPLSESYPDGGYSGAYYSAAKELIRVEFFLENNGFKTVSVEFFQPERQRSSLAEALAKACSVYLEGKGVTALAQLYHSGKTGVDLTALDFENGMLVSAFMDGLNRGVFKPVATTVFSGLSGYENGVYRGFYHRNETEDVSVQFELINDTFGAFQYRDLRYGEADYLSEDASPDQAAVYKQFRQITAYLDGKNVTALYELFAPEGIAQDADGFSAATLPTNKLISAVMDGLTRGVYKQLEID